MGRRWHGAGLVRTVPNAIDAAAFAYREEIRDKMRLQLRIPQDAFVIGHVGRFGHMKNHTFLLDVFEQVNKKIPSSMLLLVGEGGLQDMIKEKAAALGLADKVIFTGNQADVSDYYQAMDFFVFPSVFEGLPGDGDRGSGKRPQMSGVGQCDAGGADYGAGPGGTAFTGGPVRGLQMYWKEKSMSEIR